MSRQIIHIRSEAAAKPAVGARCNGCGVCCLAEPCPLGMLLSGRRSGACAALHWVGESGQYRCGAMLAPEPALRRALPVWLQWLAPVLAVPLRQLAGRWIGAGQGCDCSLEVETRHQSD